MSSLNIKCATRIFNNTDKMYLNEDIKLYMIKDDNGKVLCRKIKTIPSE